MNFYLVEFVRCWMFSEPSNDCFKVSFYHMQNVKYFITKALFKKIFHIFHTVNSLFSVTRQLKCFPRHKTELNLLISERINFLKRVVNWNVQKCFLIFMFYVVFSLHSIKHKHTHTHTLLSLALRPAFSCDFPTLIGNLLRGRWKFYCFYKIFGIFWALRTALQHFWNHRLFKRFHKFQKIFSTYSHSIETYIFLIIIFFPSHTIPTTNTILLSNSGDGKRRTEAKKRLLLLQGDFPGRKDFKLSKPEHAQFRQHFLLSGNSHRMLLTVLKPPMM